MGMVMQPVLRKRIPGPTPIWFVVAPDVGTGKTLLVEVSTGLNFGYFAVVPQPASRHEWTQTMLGSLQQGDEYFAIDNVRGQDRLDSAELAQAVTTQKLRGRILGISKTVELPVQWQWFATGNSPAVSAEIARRICLVRLDAKCPNPGLRRGFAIRDLRSWVLDHRGELLHAAYVPLRRQPGDAPALVEHAAARRLRGLARRGRWGGRACVRADFLHGERGCRP